MPGPDAAAGTCEKKEESDMPTGQYVYIITPALRDLLINQFGLDSGMFTPYGENYLLFANSVGGDLEEYFLEEEIGMYWYILSTQVVVGYP